MLSICVSKKDGMKLACYYFCSYSNYFKKVSTEFQSYAVFTSGSPSSFLVLACLLSCLHLLYKYSYFHSDLCLCPFKLLVSPCSLKCSNSYLFVSKQSITVQAMPTLSIPTLHLCQGCSFLQEFLALCLIQVLTSSHLLASSLYLYSDHPKNLLFSTYHWGFSLSASIPGVPNQLHQHPPAEMCPCHHHPTPVLPLMAPLTPWTF